MRRTTVQLTLSGLLLTFLASACDKDTPGSTSASASADALAPVRELVAAGRVDEARGLLEDLKAEQGTTPTVALGLGALLERDGEFPQAVTLYRKVADDPQFQESDPEGVGRLNARLGEVFLALNQTKAGLDRLTRAREDGIGDEMIALPLAVAHGRVEDYAAAQSELDRAEAAGASREVVLYNRALILGAEGKNADALTLFQEALALDTDDTSILREIARLELLLNPGDLEAAGRAMEHVNKAITLTEASGNLDWRSYEVLGDAFRVQGDNQAASQMYLKAKEIGQEPDERLNDKYYAVQVKLREELGITEDAPK